MTPRTIHKGAVRLYEDGRVEHWDGPLCCWRPGWGPYGTRSALGEDDRTLERWRRDVHRAHARSYAGEE